VITFNSLKCFLQPVHTVDLTCTCTVKLIAETSCAQNAFSLHVVFVDDDILFCRQLKREMSANEITETQAFIWEARWPHD